MLLNSWLLVVTLTGFHIIIATSFFPVSCWVNLYSWVLFCIAVQVNCCSGFVSFSILLITDTPLTYFSALLALYQQTLLNQTSPSQPLLEHKCRCLFFQVQLRTMGKILIFLPEHGSQLQVDTEQTEG